MRLALLSIFVLALITVKAESYDPLEEPTDPQQPGPVSAADNQQGNEEVNNNQEPSVQDPKKATTRTPDDTAANGSEQASENVENNNGNGGKPDESVAGEPKTEENQNQASRDTATDEKVKPGSEASKNGEEAKKAGKTDDSKQELIKPEKKPEATSTEQKETAQYLHLDVWCAIFGYKHGWCNFTQQTEPPPPPPQPVATTVEPPPKLSTVQVISTTMSTVTEKQSLDAKVNETSTKSQAEETTASGTPLGTEETSATPPPSSETPSPSPSEETTTDDSKRTTTRIQAESTTASGAPGPIEGTSETPSQPSSETPSPPPSEETTTDDSKRTTTRIQAESTTASGAPGPIEGTSDTPPPFSETQSPSPSDDTETSTGSIAPEEVTTAKKEEESTPTTTSTTTSTSTTTTPLPIDCVSEIEEGKCEPLATGTDKCNGERTVKYSVKVFDANNGKRCDAKAYDGAVEKQKCSLLELNGNEKEAQKCKCADFKAVYKGCDWDDGKPRCGTNGNKIFEYGKPPTYDELKIGEEICTAAPNALPQERCNQTKCQWEKSPLKWSPKNRETAFDKEMHATKSKQNMITTCNAVMHANEIDVPVVLKNDNQLGNYHRVSKWEYANVKALCFAGCVKLLNANTPATTPAVLPKMNYQIQIESKEKHVAYDCVCATKPPSSRHIFTIENGTILFDEERVGKVDEDICNKTFQKPADDADDADDVVEKRHDGQTGSFLGWRHFPPLIPSAKFRHPHHHRHRHQHRKH